MKYVLTELREHSFYAQQPAHQEKKEFAINWSFESDLDFSKKDKVSVLLEARINILKDSDHEMIAQFCATHTFKVENIDQNILDKTGDTDVFNFLATLVGISLGSMRGLAFARTYSIFGPNVVMPVVNPSALLKNELPRIKSQVNR